MKFATRYRAGRTLLTLEDAHEANFVDSIADDVERLEQALRTIGLDV
jgi:hypothetical protein